MTSSDGKRAQCHLYPEDLYDFAPHHDGDRLTCKFILIDTPEVVHFVTGPITQFKYHAVLANQFCETHSLPYIWDHKPDLGHIYDKRYRIRGGGVLTIDRTDGLIRVYGTSRAYGAYDPEAVRRAMDVCPHFRQLTLVIDR